MAKENPVQWYTTGGPWVNRILEEKTREFKTQVQPDPKLAGLRCPLCGVDRSMTYAPRHNPRVLLGLTKVWECEACPAVVFERHSPEDAKVL